jgi:hypothetical protein
VWEGALGGAAMRAALFDHKRMRLQIELPRTDAADAWTIAIDAPDPKRAWRIAELRLVGRR